MSVSLLKAWFLEPQLRGQVDDPERYPFRLLHLPSIVLNFSHLLQLGHFSMQFTMIPSQSGDEITRTNISNGKGIFETLTETLQVII